MTRDEMIEHLESGEWPRIGMVIAALRSRPAPPDDLVRAVEAVLDHDDQHDTLHGTGLAEMLRAALAAPAPVAPPDDLVEKLRARALELHDRLMCQSLDSGFGSCEERFAPIHDWCVTCVAAALAVPAPVAAPSPETPATGIDWPLTHERCPKCGDTDKLGGIMALGKEDGSRWCLKCEVRLEAFAPETPARKPFTMNVSREWVMNMARHEAETLGAAPETPAPNYTPPPTSNTADASDGSIRDRAAWTAMCERRKAETPAPDARCDCNYPYLKERNLIDEYWVHKTHAPHCAFYEGPKADPNPMPAIMVGDWLMTRFFGKMIISVLSDSVRDAVDADGVIESRGERNGRPFIWRR